MTLQDEIEDYLLHFGRELHRHGVREARMIEEARDHLVDATESARLRGFSSDAAAREAIELIVLAFPFVGAYLGAGARRLVMR